MAGATKEKPTQEEGGARMRGLAGGLLVGREEARVGKEIRRGREGAGRRSAGSGEGREEATAGGWRDLATG